MNVNLPQKAQDFKEHSKKLKSKGELKESTLRQRRYAMDEVSEWFSENDKDLDTEDYYSSIDTIKEFFEDVHVHKSKIGCLRQMLVYTAEQLPEEQAETIRDIHSRFKPSRFDNINKGHQPTSKTEQVKKNLLSDEELEAARAVAKPEERVIIDCMLDMGTRPGELAALTPSDIKWDFDRGEIGATVYIEKTYVQGEGVQMEPKTEQGYRTVNLRKDTVERLREYIDENDISDDELIFDSYRHVYNAIKDVFTFAQVKIGEDGVTNFGPHGLRHNTATRLIVDHEYPKEKVQRYLGHGSVKITELYEHFREDEVVGIYE